MADVAEVNEVNYSKVCDRLDNLAIQILNVMQNIILERQYLDDNLKEGFINMAKSRYSMRGQKIGILQINPEKLNASKKVVSNLDTTDGIKFTSFSVSEKEKSLNVSEEKQSCSATESNTTGSTKTVHSERSETCPSDEAHNSQNNFMSPGENLLKCFGVLVPNTLKVCQSRFEQAIVTSVKIVTLQNELKALSEEYRRLRKQKSILNIKA